MNLVPVVHCKNCQYLHEFDESLSLRPTCTELKITVYSPETFYCKYGKEKEDKKMTEKTALKRFEERNLVVFKELGELKQQIKELEKKQDELKKGIQEAMEHYGVTSFKNEYITISYVPESTSESIDLKALQTNEPELYEELLADYKKVTTRKGYVRFS